MQNTTTHNKDERHSLLEKYTSHFIWKGCVWEGVGDRTELQHIDPHSIGHNCVSFPFSWAAQPGTWEPSLSGTCSHSSIFSPTRLISKLINRGPEGSLCWVLAFSTASCLQLIWSPNWLNVLCTELYNCSRPPSSCGRHNFALIQPDRPDAPVIYTGAFPILIARPGRRSIYNNKRKNMLSVFNYKE